MNFIAWLSANPRTERDKEATPWLKSGNRVRGLNGDLTKVLKDVGHFVSIFGETRKEFDKQLKDLEIRLPRNINEAYLYYKYIVRKSEADFLSDFQYFRKPYTRDEWFDYKPEERDRRDEEERKRRADEEEEEAQRRRELEEERKRKEEEEKKKKKDEDEQEHEQEENFADYVDPDETPLPASLTGPPPPPTTLPSSTGPIPPLPPTPKLPGKSFSTFSSSFWIWSSSSIWIWSSSSKP